VCVCVFECVCVCVCAFVRACVRVCVFLHESNSCMWIDVLFSFVNNFMNDNALTDKKLCIHLNSL
jgi:hypothetical protein